MRPRATPSLLLDIGDALALAWEATVQQQTTPSVAMHAIGFSYNEGEEIQKTCGTITIGGTEYYNGSNKTWGSEALENALKVATFTWPTP